MPRKRDASGGERLPVDAPARLRRGSSYDVAVLIAFAALLAVLALGILGVLATDASASSRRGWRRLRHALAEARHRAVGVLASSATGCDSGR